MEAKKIMSKFKIILSSMVFIFLGLTACSEITDSDLNEIKENQKAMLEELKAIRKGIESGPTRAQQRPQQPQFKEVVLSVADNYIKGDENAPLTVVEFSDYQCPFCGRHFTNTYPQLEQEYIKSGKVKYAFADYPLAFHPLAPKASESALCAGDQGKFWEMHDVLFKNQKALQPENLPKYAEEAGVGELATFNECLEKEKYKDTVSDNFAAGQKAGIRGTPSFIIGYSTPDNKNVKFVKMVRGAQPFVAFKTEIDAMLNEKKGE